MAIAAAAIEPEPSKMRRDPKPPLVTRSFVLVVAATFAYFVAVGAVLPALPLYVEGPLGGRSVSVGIGVGAFSFSALLLRPWAGRIGDRRGRRPLVVGGAALAAASITGYLAATSLPVLVALRLLTGAGEALFFIGVVSATNDLAPDERRGEAMSLFSLAPYAGLAVGPLLGEAVLDGDAFGPVWALAAASTLLAVALGSRLPETHRAAGADAETPLRAEPPGRRRLLHPAGLLPGAVLMSIFWGFAGFNAFVPLYARQLGLGGAKLPLATFAVVLLAIRSIGASIPDRVGVARVGRAAVTGAALGLATIGLWPTAAGLLAGTVVFAGGQALAFPALMALAVRRAPASERSRVVGTFTAFVDLAFGLGPVTLGVIAGALGYRATFLAAAAVSAAGLVLLLAARRQLTPLSVTPPR
jgi:MFS family permease